MENLQKTSTHNLPELITSVESFCSKHTLFIKNDSIVIGLSGGPDSVLLAHVFAHLRKKYDLQLIAAHLDHGWRSNSAHDVSFCRKLCTELNIPLEVEHADNIPYQGRKNCSLEHRGRWIRRMFFKTIQKKYAAQRIALAHHSDDQIETFFIRLIRGATVSGLAAIRPQDGPYIRPLLSTPKSEILATLQANALSYLTDPTNETSDYLRNRIRHQVVPALQQADPRSKNAILKAIAQLQNVDQFLSETTHSKLDEFSKNNSELDFESLNTTNHYLQRRIVLQWLIYNHYPLEPSTGFLEEILRFFKNKKSQKHELSTGWSIIKKNDYAKLVQKKE